MPARVAALLDGHKKLERELAEAKKALALGRVDNISGSASMKFTASGTLQSKIGDIFFRDQVLQDFDPKGLRSIADEFKNELGSGVVAIVSVNEGRATIAVGVTDDLTTRFSAVDLVRAGVEALGGKGGGGRPDMAQGGGPDGDKAAEAIAAVRAVLAGSTN